jgi:hypothetical protein
MQVVIAYHDLVHKPLGWPLHPSVRNRTNARYA